MQTSKNREIHRWAIRLALVLFDIFAVNFSYFIALVIRFYVNSEFHGLAIPHIANFFKFAPYYTVISIIIFVLFKLYNGMWKYAGLNDVNRIVYANICTCAAQILGTLLFVKRMPITYYAIGAVIQFTLIFASRFSYRFIAAEYVRYAKGKKKSYVRTIIVGAGETARVLLRQLENDADNVVKPVCVIDLRNADSRSLFDGLPVLCGIDGIRQAVQRYGSKSVIIADSIMPTETRKEIKNLCQELKLDVQDFSGHLSNDSGAISFRRLMEYSNCEVTVASDGKTQDFDNSEQALLTVAGRYDVKAITVRNNRLFVELVNNTVNRLTVFYITNRPDVALIAEKYGVDRIWIDLETIGKEERQKNMNTVKSHHKISDISVIKPLLTKAEMLVRINSWYEGSKQEIEEVIAAGADIIMLPYWKSVEEVDSFLAAVGGRCQTTLLLETKEAVECVDEVLKRQFDEIHIGLNDLSISYGMTFMFELLANGTVEMLCQKFKKAGIPYGFGGIAKMGDGLLPAEKIIMEHYRLGSSRAILSRSFCDQDKISSIDEIDRIFHDNMQLLRDYEQSVSNMTQEQLMRNKVEVAKAVDDIVSQIKRARSNEA